MSAQVGIHEANRTIFQKPKEKNQNNKNMQAIGNQQSKNNEIVSLVFSFTSNINLLQQN